MGGSATPAPSSTDSVLPWTGTPSAIGAASNQVGARLLVGLEHLWTTFGVPVPIATLRALRDQPVLAAERLNRWALDRPIQHGAEYVQLWNAWSRSTGSRGRTSHVDISKDRRPPIGLAALRSIP